MAAILDALDTSMHILPMSTIGQLRLHSSLHFFGLHLSSLMLRDARGAGRGRAGVARKKHGGDKFAAAVAAAAAAKWHTTQQPTQEKRRAGERSRGSRSAQSARTRCKHDQRVHAHGYSLVVRMVAVGLRFRRHPRAALLRSAAARRATDEGTKWGGRKLE